MQFQGDRTKASILREYLVLQQGQTDQNDDLIEHMAGYVGYLAIRQEARAGIHH